MINRLPLIQSPRGAQNDQRSPIEIEEKERKKGLQGKVRTSGSEAILYNVRLTHVRDKRSPNRPSSGIAAAPSGPDSAFAITSSKTRAVGTDALGFI